MRPRRFSYVALVRVLVWTHLAKNVVSMVGGVGNVAKKGLTFRVMNVTFSLRGVNSSRAGRIGLTHNLMNYSGDPKKPERSNWRLFCNPGGPIILSSLEIFYWVASEFWRIFYNLRTPWICGMLRCRCDRIDNFSKQTSKVCNDLSLRNSYLFHPAEIDCQNLIQQKFSAKIIISSFNKLKNCQRWLPHFLAVFPRWN